MCSITPASIGRHRPPRSAGAMSMHVSLVAHAFLPWSCWPRFDCVNHVSCVHHSTRLTRISSKGHISFSGHADRSCIHKSHTLPMVRLSLPVVHGDDFRKAVAERPSDGPMVVSSSRGRRWYHSGSYWLTSACEVH